MSAIATVQMWGNTRALRIPKAIARESGLEAGTKVTLTPSNHGLLVRAIRPRRTYKLCELLARCKGRNPHRESIKGRAAREIF
jgi:antitoxin component of MazEF toxin-antitoxin module